LNGLRPIEDDDYKVFVKWLIDDDYKCEDIDFYLKLGLMVVFSLSVLPIYILLRASVEGQVVAVPFPILGYLFGRYLSHRHFSKFRWIFLRKGERKGKLWMRTYVPRVSTFQYENKNVKVVRTETFDHRFKVFAVFGEGERPPDYEPRIIFEPSRKSILLGYDDLDAESSKRRLLKLFSTSPQGTGDVMTDLFRNRPRRWDKIIAICAILTTLLTAILVLKAILQ
jgi:hypothetical protein